MLINNHIFSVHFQTRNQDFRPCASCHQTHAGVAESVSAGSSTARRAGVSGFSTADVGATETTSRRRKSATRRAGVHRCVTATANLVSNTTSSAVHCAGATTPARYSIFDMCVQRNIVKHPDVWDSIHRYFEYWTCSLTLRLSNSFSCMNEPLYETLDSSTARRIVFVQ